MNLPGYTAQGREEMLGEMVTVLGRHPSALQVTPPLP